MLRQRTFVVGAVAALGLVALGGPAAGDVVEPPGSCVGTASFAEGGDDGPFSVDSTALSRDDVTTVAISDTVTWSAELVGVTPGASRPISGFVKVDLPAPIPDYTVASWDGPSSLTANQGVEEYSLPDLVPRGVVIEVYGEHRESGEVFCTGSAKVKIAGSAVSSPVSIGSIALLAVSALALVLGARGRPVTGVFTGLALGLFLGATLVLLGVVPLSSALPAVLLPVGAVAGLVYGRFTGHRPGGTTGTPTQGSGPTPAAVP